MANEARKPVTGTIVETAGAKAGEQVDAGTGESQGSKKTRDQRRGKVNLVVLDNEVQGLKSNLQRATTIAGLQANEVTGLKNDLQTANTIIAKLQAEIKDLEANTEAVSSMQTRIEALGGKAVTLAQVREIAATEASAMKADIVTKVTKAAEMSGDEAFAMSMRGEAPEDWWEKLRFNMKKSFSTDRIIYVMVVGGALFVAYHGVFWVLRNYVEVPTYWKYDTGLAADHRAATAAAGAMPPAAPPNGAGRPRIMATRG